MGVIPHRHLNGRERAEYFAVARHFLSTPTSVRDIARLTLEAFELEVILAADGKEGLESFLANREKVAAILLDLTMPVLGGVATFEELRRLDSDEPIVIMSGYSEDEILDRLSGEDVLFLQKPFSVDRLIERLSEVLESRVTS